MAKKDIYDVQLKTLREKGKMLEKRMLIAQETQRIKYMERAMKKPRFAPIVSKFGRGLKMGVGELKKELIAHKKYKAEQQLKKTT